MGISGSGKRVSVGPITMAAAASAFALCGAAHATLIYSNNFENAAPGAEWANGRYTSAPAFSQFMGRYGTTDSTTLTIPAIPPPEGPHSGTGTGGGGGGESLLYNVTFDFYPIDSWDGTDAINGPDTFELKINGAIVFNEAFANHSLSTLQTYREPDIGPTQLGFGTDADSIYRNISVDFTVDPTATQVQIKFRSSLTQAMADESWGIDNVRVGYSVVPTPGATALLALGGLVASRRRR